ncbi:deoxyribose-phosphate aldolase [Microbacterium esteraromaticum]|uniref:Deoxyribose-phosphate aldolase n=1 Tax=Microbacterium esteraromaticum TaxID=57043 RepID=A0A7D7WGR0_9MICO|nr:deoxyribose-phosphate aldolase [Microbacterium esteraromaticum]QMU97114.1 deoxyribose-phosphate aldolase [Microbacterium esteraromaticum]
MNAPVDTELASRIQHTLIAAGVTRDQMIAHAREAITYGFAAAMVPGSWVDVVARELEGTAVQVASALDFPTVGVMTTTGKAREAEELVRLGAHQIDMGVQIGWLKSGDWDRFSADIRAVVAAGVPVKVMLELPLLTPQERETAVTLSIEAGAAYLKNASSGAVEIAHPDSIRFLVERVPEGVGVKASGGITSAEQARALLDAGAQLLGTSAGIGIVTSGSGEQSY